jgi:hypothetical protein
MTDDELRPVLTELQQYEGREHSLYLDNAEHPNVTVGVGCLISSVDAAQRLPFHHITDGLRATPDEIARDFFRVRSMRGGLPARAYRGSLALSDADIDALGFSRLREFFAGLPGVFPGFDGFPLSVRQVLLDLAFNVGLGAEATSAHAATGLRAWVGLRAACNSVPPDWRAASHECTTENPERDKGREARNAYRSRGFLLAAGMV